MQKKKWWAWPWFHQCPTQPTAKTTISLEPNGTPKVVTTVSTPGPQAPPRLPIYVEWADSVQVPEESRTKASH
ncbi:hypothetical protein N7471_001359 [Penicillium samsonianum]|uniref:uncharacterized protein n=1 Tax=Penicillium samsonianum TaxID=1882272 RepID=UPI00254878D6|nr:uncharacterized protein N7471_001359 [Penicillium samsonianum]KAJ6150160.1 hypothetical protein N7471_001359 [Penicillium samsonianum]